MINAIIKGIFWLITKLFNIILLPIVALIYALFPSLGNYFTYIIQYFVMATTYVRAILQLLLIEQSSMQALFDYFVIMYSIYYTTLAVRFAINVYNKLKL